MSPVDDERQIISAGKTAGQGPIVGRTLRGAVAVISLAPGGLQIIAQPIISGQAVSAAFPPGVENLANYQAAAGTIVAAVREASVAGGAFSATLTATPPVGTLVAIRTRVTDSLGNVRLFPTAAGSFTTVQAVAPGSPQDGDAVLIWVAAPPAAIPGAPQDGDAELVFLFAPPGAPQDGDAELIWSAA